MLAGTELRKQRRLGEVLTDSFNILFEHWRQLAVISIPVVIANIAFSLVILAITQDLPTAEEIANNTAELTTEELTDLLIYGGGATLIALPILFVMQQLVTGGAIVYMDERDKGNSIAPPEALDRAQDNLRPLIGAALRASVILILILVASFVASISAFTVIGRAGIAVGLILIPFAVNRFVRWAFLAQVVMLEGKRGGGVLARSSDLVKGRWWNTFGRLILVGLVIQIPVSFLQSALAEAAPGVFGTVLVGATGFIYVPFGIIALSLMYFDLHARKAENDVIRTFEEPAT